MKEENMTAQEAMDKIFAEPETKQFMADLWKHMDRQHDLSLRMLKKFLRVEGE